MTKLRGVTPGWTKRISRLLTGRGGFRPEWADHTSRDGQETYYAEPYALSEASRTHLKGLASLGWSVRIDHPETGKSTWFPGRCFLVTLKPPAISAGAKK